MSQSRFCWWCSRQLRSFKGVPVVRDGVVLMCHKFCAPLAQSDDDPEDHGGHTQAVNPNDHFAKPPRLTPRRTTTGGAR